MSAQPVSENEGNKQTNEKALSCIEPEYMLEQPAETSR